MLQSVSTLWERSVPRALALLALLPLGVAVTAQSDPEVGTDTSGGETEGQLNCFEVWFPGTNLHAIVPNYPDMGPAFAARMRTFAKRILRANVLGSENALMTAKAAGSLYGLEYDWFFAMPSPATTGLPTAGPLDVYGSGPGGEPKLFAQVFGYDAASYAARKAMVEAMVGHAMETYVVYVPDLVAVDELGLSGASNELFGPLSAQVGVAVTGTANRHLGPLHTPAEPWAVPGNELGLLIQGTPAPRPRPSVSAETLRARAQASGTWFPGDLTIDATNLPPDGLVFAEGSIVVAGDDLRGRWTLVSAAGGVSLRGDRLDLVPALRGQLALALTGSISVRGDRGRLEGVLSAPNGRLAVAGDRNRLLGALDAASLELTGSANLLTDGSEVLAP